MTSNLSSFLDRPERIKKMLITQCKANATAKKCYQCKKICPERFEYCSRTN